MRLNASKPGKYMNPKICGLWNTTVFNRTTYLINPLFSLSFAVMAKKARSFLLMTPMPISRSLFSLTK